MSQRRFVFGYRVYEMFDEKGKFWVADILRKQTYPPVDVRRENLEVYEPRLKEMIGDTRPHFDLSGDAVEWAKARCAELQQQEIDANVQFQLRDEANIVWPDPLPGSYVNA